MVAQTPRDSNAPALSIYAVDHLMQQAMVAQSVSRRQRAGVAAAPPAIVLLNLG